MLHVATYFEIQSHPSYSHATDLCDIHIFSSVSHARYWRINLVKNLQKAGAMAKIVTKVERIFNEINI